MHLLWYCCWPCYTNACYSVVHNDYILGLFCSEMKTRMKLDENLSRALNIRLNNGRLNLIDEDNYVLTLDYALKMLNIHERFKCGVPVIIEGETGVGKTKLVEMLSKLWNQSFSEDLNCIVEQLEAAANEGNYHV